MIPGPVSAITQECRTTSSLARPSREHHIRMQQADTAAHIPADGIVATDTSPLETFDPAKKSTAAAAYRCPLPQAADHRSPTEQHHQSWIGPDLRCPKVQPQRARALSARGAAHHCHPHLRITRQTSPSAGSRRAATPTAATAHAYFASHDRHGRKQPAAMARACTAGHH